MSEYIVSKSQETSGWDIHYGKRFIRNVQRQQIALMFSDELHRERFIISQTENKRIAELETENKLFRAQLGIDKTTSDDSFDELKSYTASIDSIKRFTMKKGQQMAILTLSLGAEIVVFPRTWDANKIVLSGLNETNRDATFHCSISNSDNRNTIVLNTVVIDEYTERKADNE